MYFSFSYYFSSSSLSSSCQFSVAFVFKIYYYCNTESITNEHLFKFFINIENLFVCLLDLSKYFVLVMFRDQISLILNLLTGNMLFMIINPSKSVRNNDSFMRTRTYFPKLSLLGNDV